MLKSATFAPMQAASVRTAVSVKLLSFESSRNASRQSCMAVDSPWTESAGNSFTGSFMSEIVTSTHGSPGGCTSSPSTRQRTWPRSVELRVIGSRPFLLRIWRDRRGNRRARIGRNGRCTRTKNARVRSRALPCSISAAPFNARRCYDLVLCPWSLIVPGSWCLVLTQMREGTKD